jgi:hypothetical protein
MKVRRRRVPGWARILLLASGVVVLVAGLFFSWFTYEYYQSNAVHETLHITTVESDGTLNVWDRAEFLDYAAFSRSDMTVTISRTDPPAGESNVEIFSGTPKEALHFLLDYSYGSTYPPPGWREEQSGFLLMILVLVVLGGTLIVLGAWPGRRPAPRLGQHSATTAGNEQRVADNLPGGSCTPR